MENLKEIQVVTGNHKALTTRSKPQGKTTPCSDAAKSAAPFNSALGKYMKNIYITLLLLFLPFTVYSECNVSNEKHAHFSNTKTPDRFVVQTKGKDCNSATKYIQIFTSKNKLIYEHISALSDGFRENITLENAEYVVELVLREDFFGKTNKLPKWEPHDMYYENNMQEITVSKSYYKMLQGQNWPTFTHHYGYEGFVTIVFDPNKNKVVEVTSGSA